MKVQFKVRRYIGVQARFLVYISKSQFVQFCGSSASQELTVNLCRRTKWQEKWNGFLSILKNPLGPVSALQRMWWFLNVLHEMLGRQVCKRVMKTNISENNNCPATKNIAVADKEWYIVYSAIQRHECLQRTMYGKHQDNILSTYNIKYQHIMLHINHMNCFWILAKSAIQKTIKRHMKM